MPQASVARPISPTSASISRTRCPLATPPTAGLHDICAMVSTDDVSTRVRAPMRAAASAASQPACPAPTTMTSNSSGYRYKRGDTSLFGVLVSLPALGAARRRLRFERIDVQREVGGDGRRVRQIGFARGPVRLFDFG